jgi:hypothetical protein
LIKQGRPSWLYQTPIYQHPQNNPEIASLNKNYNTGNHSFSLTGIGKLARKFYLSQLINILLLVKINAVQF